MTLSKASIMSLNEDPNLNQEAPDASLPPHSFIFTLLKSNFANTMVLNTVISYSDKQARPFIQTRGIKKGKNYVIHGVKNSNGRLLCAVARRIGEVFNSNHT